jgi:hypothetical protein
MDGWIAFKLPSVGHRTREKAPVELQLWMDCFQVTPMSRSHLLTAPCPSLSHLFVATPHSFHTFFRTWGWRQVGTVPPLFKSDSGWMTLQQPPTDPKATGVPRT